MDALFAWLGSLPRAVLYLALAAAAATENVFPPFPADTVVAFGSFLAARGRAGFVGAFLAAWLGNVAGAMAVYAAGRKVGAMRDPARRSSFGRPDSARRLGSFYQRRGLVALAISRFLPGVRALVPPFAGAVGIPAWRFAAIIAAASALWYGLITAAAYRLAANWEALQALVSSLTRGAGLVGAIAALLALGAWYVARRTRARPADRDPTEDARPHV